MATMGTAGPAQALAPESDAEGRGGDYQSGAEHARAQISTFLSAVGLPDHWTHGTAELPAPRSAD
ncbi:hypothetical protein GCM10010515_56070 [Streptomyces fructofermentans]|uniref:Uncharacterized protein n=2 Tax=Streptomyces fructofermentans TaxID=152141 RepID=A0A918NMR7_9ACTN|nr:hypothetical protein GCM10010515_56070 [Streptomyces fructofermentans]